MDRRQAPCPRAPAGPRRCQCLAGPIRPRNNPSARAFLGLPSPNSVALVDHWHRPASGTRGLTVQTNQPGGSSIVICLWPWCCLCFCFAPSLPPPPDPSAQLAPTKPNPTQPKLCASSSLTICLTQSKSPHLLPTRSTLFPLPPTLAPIISLLLARSLDSR